MGYYTSFTGKITITPPLTWAQIKDSPWLFAAHGTDRDLKLDIREEAVETAEGTLVRREATAVVPVTDDAYKGYEIVEQLQQLVDAYPGHGFGGYIRADGEESGDIWQLRVVDGRATKVTPRIIWPDGSEESAR